MNRDVRLPLRQLHIDVMYRSSKEFNNSYCLRVELVLQFQRQNDCADSYGYLFKLILFTNIKYNLNNKY